MALPMHRILTVKVEVISNKHILAVTSSIMFSQLFLSQTDENK